MRNPIALATTALLPFVIITGLLAACAPAGDDAAADAPHVVAREELRIGEADGAPELTFGRVGGVTGDAAGRIIVVDMQAHELRVFDRDGRFAFRAGREGGGPGELREPCCPAFAPDGLLWIRDGGNRRWVAFVLGDSGALARGQIRMQHGDLNRMVPSTFDDDGALVDVGSASAGPDAGPVTVRFSYAPDGAVGRRVEVQAPPPESLGVHLVRIPRGDGHSVRFFYQPYGPQHRVAHGPGGAWADAVTSRYAVAWRGPDGTPLRTVQRDVEGPRLTADERRRADSALASDARRAGGPLPFDIPDRKPPIRTLHFDAMGRLWVERSVPAGAPRMADVWARDASLAFTLEWPADVDLTLGWIGDGEALGIATDELGVQRIVRIAWR